MLRQIGLEINNEQTLIQGTIAYNQSIVSQIPIPNLLIVTAHQILQKRNNKLQKLQKQPVHNVAATNKYQILFNTTQNIDLSSEIEEYENRLISWETSEHNIYSTSNVSNNQIKPITQRLQSILNKSNSVHQLHYQQNDKDISMVFRDINKFTNRQLMKISPKQMVNKKSVKNNGKSKNQSKNTNVIVPKLRIPKIIDNKVNFQQLLNQYDQIMQQRYCQTERQSKSDKQQTNKGQLYNKQQQSIYSVPSSSNFPGKGLSTCSASLLLKSLSKMSMDKSPMTSRRLEIKQNLTNLIKQQERDMGFYTQR